MKILLTIVLYAFAPVLHVYSADLEFLAYMRIGEKQLFVLVERETRASSGWIAVGETFMSTVPEEFDIHTKSLLVRDELGRRRLFLKAEGKASDGDSKTPPPRVEMTITISELGDWNLNGVKLDADALKREFARLLNQGLAITISLCPPKSTSPEVTTRVKKSIDDLTAVGETVKGKRGWFMVKIIN